MLVFQLVEKYKFKKFVIFLFYFSHARNFMLSTKKNYRARKNVSFFSLYLRGNISANFVIEV